MTQTILKYYDDLTSLNDKAIVIGAHCNTEMRKNRCIELLQTIKQKLPNYTIILCSHIPIEKDFYQYIDFAIFNKNNPIINYDIIDKTTDYRTLTICTEQEQISKSVQTNGYSHHLHVYDGLTFAVKQRMKSIHYMSYDVVFEVIDKISLHEHFLKDYDGVSYRYVNDNFLNTEFFSINAQCAEKTICKCLTYEEFITAGHGDIGHETVYYHMFKPYKFKILDFFHTDGRNEPWIIGDFPAMPLNTDRKKISILPSNLNGLIIIPYNTNGAIRIVVSLVPSAFEDNNNICEKFQFVCSDINHNQTNEKTIFNLTPSYIGEIFPESNSTYVEIIVNDNSWLKFDLRDSKNYGHVNK